MKHYLYIFLALLLIQFNNISYADVCPPTNDNPHRPIPERSNWKKYPYTIDDPQSASNTTWERANILITPTGVILGVSCDYKYKTDRYYYYTIWRESNNVTKIGSGWKPSPQSKGYFCTSKEHDVNQCEFDVIDGQM